MAEDEALKGGTMSGFEVWKKDSLHKHIPVPLRKSLDLGIDAALKAAWKAGVEQGRKEAGLMYQHTREASSKP